jgi:hypothetical protein
LDIPRVLPDELERFIRTHGKAGQKILSSLYNLYPELSAVFGTEVGSAILIEDIKRLDEIFIRIYQETATVEEKAEFRYLRDIRLPRLIGKLSTYIQKTYQIKEGGVK